MHGKHATGKVQRNNHQDEQFRPSFAGKMSSVSLSSPMHAQRLIGNLGWERQAPRSVKHDVSWQLRRTIQSQ